MYLTLHHTVGAAGRYDTTGAHAKKMYYILAIDYLHLELLCVLVLLGNYVLNA